MNRTKIGCLAVAFQGLAAAGCAVEAGPDATLETAQTPLVAPIGKDPGVASEPPGLEPTGGDKGASSPPQTPRWAWACDAKSSRYQVFMREWDTFACHDIDGGTGVWRGVDGATPGTCTFEWSGAGTPDFSALTARARYDAIAYHAGEETSYAPLVIQDCSPPCKRDCAKVVRAISASGMGRSPCSACGVVSGGVLHMTVPSFVAVDDYVVRTPDGQPWRIFAYGQQVLSIHLPSAKDGPVSLE